MVGLLLIRHNIPLQSLDVATELRQAKFIEEQSKDPKLVALIQYVKEGVVPENQALAKRLAMEGIQYNTIDSVLHHENPNQPGEWRVEGCGSGWSA